MPYTPEIDIRALGKTEVFDEDRFFRMLSEQNNYVDHKTVIDFYMGLVRHLRAELKTNGVVRLPHIGDMALVKQKPKIGWAGKFQTMIVGSYILKFYPLEKWRKYFKELEGRPGREGKLDPREKVLNREI